VSFAYSYLRTHEEVAECIRLLNNQPEPVVLDIETTGLNRFQDKLVSIQLCVAGSEQAFYFDAEYADELKNLTTPLVLHNFKFDFAFLHQLGIDLRRVLGGPDGGEGMQSGEVSARLVRDTMLMHHLLDENAAHDLDSLVKERWNDPYKEVFWSRNPTFQEAPESERLEYACKDVIYTGKLYLDLQRDLLLQEVPEALIAHVHKLAISLYDTELRGVRVDLDYLVRIGAELKQKIDTAIPRMREAAGPALDVVETELWLERIDKAITKLKTDEGKARAAQRIRKEELNWDSGQQLQKLIYGGLGLPIQSKWDKKTKTERPTLDDNAMEELAGLHPLIEEIREHRANQKVYGSFIEGTLERQVGGRVYPAFHVNGTVTGRISSSNPNLQQLSREGGIRGIYVPDPGYKLISCDYGMLEVVIAAHYSQDPNLLKIIHEGASKHDITANALGIPRQTAKTLNFAMQYQCSPFKVAQILGCSKKDAQDAWNKYWEAYAEEKKVIDECKARVDRGLPIIGLYGRQRRFPHVFASKADKEKAYRQAYSALIQGSGSDIVHQAFYTFADYMERSRCGRALFEVHDQLLGQAKEEVAEEALAKMGRIMIDIGPLVRLTVPLTVDPQGPMGRWED
jgi:DNA polymerase I-like protein with 3'-5' exonuclease and polymerase domains